MDKGTRFGYHKLLRFNGHFFANAEALPLDNAEIAILRRAAEADWSAVEPSIFGTLLVRALTPEERHRLGAEYTPHAFIELLVRPTVEEPVRERWTAVQAEVLQLMESPAARKARKDGKDSADARKARRSVLEFHAWLRGLQILDPACGSGNFLYVTMHTLKRIEVEVFRLLRELSGGQLDARLSKIDPSQFHGIEVKAWAREIAELTLWIGFHQFWRQQHGDVQPDSSVRPQQDRFRSMMRCGISKAQVVISSPGIWRRSRFWASSGPWTAGGMRRRPRPDRCPGPQQPRRRVNLADLSESVRIRPNLSNLSKSVRIRPNLSKSVQICPNLSKSVQICPNELV